MRHVILPKRRMMGLIFLLFRRVFMDRIKMNHKMDKTFEEGFEEFVLDMKARTFLIFKYNFLYKMLLFRSRVLKVRPN